MCPPEKEKQVRTFKMLGLAGIVAITAMAFLGAGTASATRLCKTSAGSGTCASTYASGTSISASSSEWILKTSLGSVKCKKATLNAKTTSAGGGAGVAVAATIEGQTFTECKLGSTNCTVTAVHLNYTAAFAWTSGNNGSFIVGTGTGGEPGVYVVCGSIIDCTFVNEAVQLDLDGGAPALVLGKEEILDLQAGGFFCPPSTAAWTATFTVAAPNPLFISNS
jgi:hypothetical protein